MKHRNAQDRKELFKAISEKGKISIRRLALADRTSLEHNTYLHLVSGLVYPLFITLLPGFGKSICFSFDQIMLSPWPLIPFWVKCCQYPESCHRYVHEKSYLQNSNPSYLFDPLYNNIETFLSTLAFLCFVSMMWETLWPSFDGSLSCDRKSTSKMFI